VVGQPAWLSAVCISRPADAFDVSALRFVATGGSLDLQQTHTLT
jgi:hypothetical protein